MVAHTRPTLIYHNFWPRANANARIAALKRACYELLGMMLSLPRLIPSKIGHILEVSVTKKLTLRPKPWDLESYKYDSTTRTRAIRPERMSLTSLGEFKANLALASGLPFADIVRIIHGDLTETFCAPRIFLPAHFTSIAVVRAVVWKISLSSVPGTNGMNRALVSGLGVVLLRLGFVSLGLGVTMPDCPIARFKASAGWSVLLFPKSLMSIAVATGPCTEIYRGHPADPALFEQYSWKG